MLARASGRQTIRRLPAMQLTAALLACLVASGIAPAGADTPAATIPTTLKDCEQTDSAPLVIRACSNILNGGSLESAERTRILLLRAVGWGKEEDFHAAADDYSSVLEIEPENVAAREGRAKALAKAADYVKSVADWTHLITFQPNNDFYFRSRGLARLGAGAFPDALADFDVSLALNPKEVEAYMGRAQVFDAMKDIERAKAEFNKAIAINDRYLPLFWMRGEMARAWGDKELALESYARVLAINSLHEDARRRMFYLGVLHPP